MNNNNNNNKKSYTPMNKRTATTTTTSSVNVENINEFPPLTTTKSSYSNMTILNFLQAAKKIPEPEEQSLMNADDDDDNHVDDVEPFKKGCSFYTDEELILQAKKSVNK